MATAQPAQAPITGATSGDGPSGAPIKAGQYAYRRPRTPADQWRWLRRSGAVVVGLWAASLIALSSVVYHRSFLGEDYATYNQAWTLIGQGHLNPYDTVYGFPFIKADFELILWPLALIHLALPQPNVLLWIQDLAIAGTGLVTFVWITEFLQRKEVHLGTAVVISSVALIAYIANPGIYGTLRFDLHMEPLSTLFLLLAGRDLWRGRLCRAWVWVAIVLLCGSFSAIMVVGLGVSALLAGRETRRSGLLLITVGLAWTGLISVLHANQGSAISQYAYLADRQTLTGSNSVALILGGALTHPWRVTDQLSNRLGDMFTLIKPVGVIGLASAWGFGIPVTVILVDALNSQPDFLREPFQNFAVYPFVLLGTVMVLVGVAERFAWGVVVALMVAVVVTMQSLDYAYSSSPNIIRGTISEVAPDTAAQLRLALARTPPDAEVIATLGIMGRFCARQWCYFFSPDVARQVHTREVVFVFDTPAETRTTSTGSLNAIAYVRDRLHARVLADAAGVAAFAWTPPPGTIQVTIPTTRQP